MYLFYDGGLTTYVRVSPTTVKLPPTYSPPPQGKFTKCVFER